MLQWSSSGFREPDDKYPPRRRRDEFFSPQPQMAVDVMEIRPSVLTLCSRHTPFRQARELAEGQKNAGV